MPEKEYTFQCILSYTADSEEDAWSALAYDLKHNQTSLFDLIKILPDTGSKKESFFELCPECEEEVNLKAEFKKQVCPNCGKPIKPCGLCDKSRMSCNKCDL